MRLLNLLHILHFARIMEMNAVVKILLSCVHDAYLCLNHKIDVNMDVIHHIIGLSKVGMDPASHFVGKNLDRKLAAKLTKEFKHSKGGRVHDAANIKYDVLRFIVQLLAR